jgi:hypothetical protein
MTEGQVVAWAACFAAGAGTAAPLAALRIARPASAPVRVNWRGARVPVVLGAPLAAGTAGGLALGWWAFPGQAGDFAAAVVLAAGLMWAAGEWDDRRGDEAERGFKGHLKAAASGRLTGGMVKIAAGVVAGLASGAVVARGWDIALAALLVAASANLVNLLDRAPGRAGKASLVLLVLVTILGPFQWALASAGVTGALVALLIPDLAERGMLGDAGANLLGAVAGLGLAGALSTGGEIVVLGGLLALNLASERWSFSEVIERNRALRVIDAMGRRRALGRRPK